MTFKEARIKAGYTQEQLAMCTRISISTIRNLEQNNSKLGQLSWLNGELIRLYLRLEPTEFYYLAMEQWDAWSDKKYHHTDTD